MEHEKIARMRGGKEQDIESAWVNFGYLIVNDCCEEWVRWSKVIRKLKVKQKLMGDLSRGEEMLLTRAIGERRACASWLNSDMCLGLCGYTGEELMDAMERRLAHE